MASDLAAGTAAGHGPNGAEPAGASPPPGAPAGDAEGAAAAGDAEERAGNEIPGAGDDPERGDAAETETDAGGETDAEERAAAGGEATEATEFRSLSELLEAAGLEGDAAGELEVSVKIDGTESKVALRDLLANHQKSAAADKRLAEAKARAKAVHEELAAKHAEWETSLAQTAKVLEHLEGQLQADTKAVDWAKLRDEDPGEYAAKREEIAERRQQLERLKSDAVRSVEEVRERQRAEQQQAFEATVAEERERLVEAIPEWQDGAKAKQEMARIRDYLTEQGFPAEAINRVSNHREIVLARKAMLYDLGRNGAAAKKVVKTPRTLRPGARASGQKPKPKSTAELFYGA